MVAYKTVKIGCFHNPFGKGFRREQNKLISQHSFREAGAEGYAYVIYRLLHWAQFTCSCTLESLFIIIKSSTYFSLPNSRTVSNKRTGWKICQKIINAQDLINAQPLNKTNMTYKAKKHTGWEIFLKLINAQCLISSHRTDFFLEKK